MKIETKYYPIKLGDKTIEVRKWKGKDRNKLKELFKDENIKTSQINDLLVRGCLKEEAALTPDEIQYTFIKLRSLSISPMFKLNYKCSCEHLNENDLNIDDLFSFKYSELKNIESGGIVFELGRIKNIQKYNELIDNENNSDIIDIIDLAMHIETVNGSLDYSFDELLEFLDDLPVDILDDIINQYEEAKFTILNKKEIKCSNCSKVQTFIFDEIPDFFPESWVI